MNRSTSMYQDMASRTGSSIYIWRGGAGPHRKSTFIQTVYGDAGAAQY